MFLVEWFNVIHMLHLLELQVLRCVVCLERQRGCGKIGLLLRPLFPRPPGTSHQGEEGGSPGRCREVTSHQGEEGGSKLAKQSLFTFRAVSRLWGEISLFRFRSFQCRGVWVLRAQVVFRQVSTWIVIFWFLIGILWLFGNNSDMLWAPMHHATSASVFSQRIPECRIRIFAYLFVFSLVAEKMLAVEPLGTTSDTGSLSKIR